MQKHKIISYLNDTSNHQTRNHDAIKHHASYPLPNNN